MLSKLKRALWALLRRSQAELELDEELRYHLERQKEQNLRLGMNSEEARSAARRSFGGVEQAKEQSRDARGVRWLEELWLDLRYGARMFLKNPGFTLIAVITLALGIGANTAIFSVVNAVLLKPLAYAQPEQLVMVYGEFPAFKTNIHLSIPEYLDFRQQTRSFAASGAYDNGSANLASSEGSEPERVERGSVTPGLFEVLQVAPLLGRIFTVEEAQAGDNVILISHSLWQRRFAGKADVIGNNVTISGKTHTIIGVMPPGFVFPPKTDIWEPMSFPTGMTDPQKRGAGALDVLARLQSGVSLKEAQAELDRLGAQIAAQYPQYYGADRRYRMIVAPLLEDIVGELKPALLRLAGAVVFVLLIACANVANLLLARATKRRQEMAVRLALGAGRGRLARQLLTESVLLALLGGVAGLLLATWGVRLLLRFVPENLPRLGTVNVDGRVLAFTALASLLTGVIFGLVPALQAAQADVHQTLREGGRSGTSAPQQRLRNAFTIAEIALALVLLTGAGLMLKSFWRLQAVEPGFNSDGVLTLRMLLPFTSHSNISQRATFFRHALERIRAVPGVSSAGAVSRIPMVPGSNSGLITGENAAGGATMNQNAPQTEVEIRWASPDYFKTMEITLLRGRDFNDADVEGTLPVAIVDENFARRFYPNEDPIGKRIKSGKPDSTLPWKTIVGVVRSVRNQRLDTTSLPQAYFPVFQEADEMYNLSFAVRSGGSDPATLAGSVRAAVLAADRNQPVYDVKPLRQIVADSIALKRLALLLLSVFAIVALLLAAAGIYGVIAYTVSQRTQEIGIRMALGAKTHDVLRLVIRQGLILTGIGVALGWVAALWLTNLLKGLLYNVSSTDPATFLAIALLLALVAVVACYIPARRASKVNPTVALRCD